MQHRIQIGVIVVLFMLIGGMALWFGGFFSGIKDVRENTEAEDNVSSPHQDAVEHKDAVNTEAVSENILPPIPSDFDVIDQDTAELKGELREKYTALFDDIVRKIREGSANENDWLDLGSVKYTFGDYKGAESAWLYVLKLDPFRAVAYADLAQLYWHKLPNYPKAEEMFLKYIDININSNFALPAYKDLSDLYRYNYKEKSHLADDVLIEALEQFPDEPGLLLALARYYADIADNDSAIQYFKKVLEVNPENESAKEELKRLTN
ncbi:MAG: hypothetical protein A3C80_00305 [Candidatus Ryanbacteria bacterium RIFCSPHIGHO2_02_FULL_45_43]|uniref:Uncharacterized protein n=1 Tax=Candidatus Ryanbacteria bacterium RIFCSPHIGHO2_01_45_13 TaxID=1802112 RepID=A0A1G2FXF8_9BACT|nr:MAG: hypothetical protein A2718_01695 [Candidatus Ryanbacteria bacterium RIFCSPHIGHO2_01_FULL_44_130]OGZ42753.1 MAG: hypothetical protein A2W41_03370 [Candidatus Ryanbacteria bacterium RIFCSPHIGHO2_01_45_13]OGZ48759.1 MAG: hypothetical protein A3C80_00305 [Candidatus Ryanbacteria bacterium RIFCSPHIGHO2_02_FULL_45_43]OGZ50791.1 MAG: hypothetical protein A3E55_02325 [Candidatus Ryanbacteria bacterium RIFCSPHIGHO2_12_FULL_44_20]OGZ52002.1 MAG: hypothetical protein A3A17_00910 [Candidatus Ryanba